MKIFNASLIFLLVVLFGCEEIDSKYSNIEHGMKYGFPELAYELGRVKSNCVVTAKEWEPVFVRNHITTKRRVANTLNGMIANGQAKYFQDKRVLAITAKYCGTKK